MDPGKTLAEFWPYYLEEHKDPANVALHVFGSSLAIVLIILAPFTSYWLLLFALISGYGFAWFGHFIIERNRPATFRHPIRSFLSDWKLWWYGIRFKLGAEYRKLDIWK